MICPNCDNSNNVTTQWMVHPFPVGDPPIYLKAYIPVNCCHNCEEQFLTHEAEEIMDKTMKDYLKSKGKSNGELQKKHSTLQ